MQSTRLCKWRKARKIPASQAPRDWKEAAKSWNKLQAATQQTDSDDLLKQIPKEKRTGEKKKNLGKKNKKWEREEPRRKQQWQTLLDMHQMNVGPMGAHLESRKIFSETKANKRKKSRGAPFGKMKCVWNTQNHMWEVANTLSGTPRHTPAAWTLSHHIYHNRDPVTFFRLKKNLSQK